jgi:cell division protein FtsW
MTTSVQPLETPELGSVRQPWRDRPCGEPLALGLVVLALMAVGILMVYSASRSATLVRDSLFFIKHIIFVPVAVGAMVAGAYFPYRRLNSFWPAVLVFGTAVALCGLVLVFGVERNHAKRWFEIGVGAFRISIQPSEIAKFAMVIFLAWFFSPHPAAAGRFAKSRFLGRLYRVFCGEAHSFWRGFVPALAAIGVVCALIAKEDFGTAALIGAVAVGIGLIAGWRWWFTLFLTLPATAGFYWFVWLVPYRRIRIEMWLDPWKYFDGKGWHVCQSLMGIGSGGVAGAGLGAGIQKLYIPEVTTDFIFAAICEEMGLMGGLLVLGLFAVLVWRAGRVVRSAPDRFSFLLASGILLTIGLQAAINMGVVTGALPAKGISLPFISYGGSGLVMMSFAAGLLIAVARARGSLPAGAAACAPQVHPLVYVPAPIANVQRGEEKGAVPFSGGAKGTVPFSQQREKGTAPFVGPPTEGQDSVA